MQSALSTSSIWRPLLLPKHYSLIYRRELSTPPPPSGEPPEVTIFSGTSRPRPYYLKHPPPARRRDLPHAKNGWPIVLAFAAAGVAGWTAFLTYVANQEKLSSSIFKQIMRSVRNDDKLKDLLGDAIRPEPEWWLNGDPRIIGSISTMQGSVDISFRIKGSKGAGTVYFTSIRKEKGSPFSILRFKVIADDGTVLLIDSDSPHGY